MYTGDGAHWLPELGTITRRWVETWGRHLIMGRQVTVNKWVWDFLKMIITALETLLMQHQQLVERKLFYGRWTIESMPIENLVIQQ